MIRDMNSTETTLGPLRIDSPLVLAPMAGYTDSPARRIARRMGAGMVVSELISAEGIARNQQKTMDLLRFTTEEHPIGIQIFGRNADVMAEAARKAAELGPDFIDINMGCCAPKVCAGGGGATLLKDPAIIESLASAVARAVTIPVSVKIRIGWDDQHKNYTDIVHALENSGVAFISVHGRTRAQKFSGLADWDIIAQIAQNSSLPVIGNGDIRSHEDALYRLGSSGCRAVMIGRASVGNPWIFGNEAPALGDIIGIMKTHLELMVDFYGDYGIILMRKHCVKYIHGFDNAAKVRTELLKASAVADVFAILDSL